MLYEDAVIPLIIDYLADARRNLKISPDLRAVMHGMVTQAIASGKLQSNDCLRSHNMPISWYLDQAVAGRADNGQVEHLADLISTMHLLDISFAVARLCREQPDLSHDGIALRAMAQCHDAARSGDFGIDFPRQTDLARSAWTGQAAEVSFKGWQIQAHFTAISSPRLGRVRRPVSRITLPGEITVEMHFPTGRLHIGCDCPNPQVAAEVIGWRQASGGGLEQDLAITDRAIDTFHMVIAPRTEVRGFG